MFRAFIGGLSFASILFAAPWVPLICAGILAVRYRAWEIVILGMVVDLLYVPPGGIYGIPIPATLAALVLVSALEPIRQKLLV